MKRKVLYAYMQPGDVERIIALAKADGMNVSQLMRAALNDMLEEQGEPLLEPLLPRGQQPVRFDEAAVRRRRRYAERRAR